MSRCEGAAGENNTAHQGYSKYINTIVILMKGEKGILGGQERNEIRLTAGLIAVELHLQLKYSCNPSHQRGSNE